MNDANVTYNNGHRPAFPTRCLPTSVRTPFGNGGEVMSETKRRGQAVVDTDLSDAAFQRAFTGGDVPVAVYGLGKMGLPIAATFAERSGNVTGVDLDPAVVAAIESGECPVRGEPSLPELVRSQVESDRFTATTDGDLAAAAGRIHVVIVPTLVDENDAPDLSHLQAAIETIAGGLDVGDAVFVESTVPPRTCADVIRPTLADRSDLDPGDFGLAFCPERTASGRALRDIRSSYPKVVGGVDPASTRAARRVYECITDNDVLTVADTTTAECVKVFEGLYRDVNIALANELATFVDEIGVDVVDAIEVANTVPYCDLHTPGAGVGGHCIPYYPYFLLQQFDTPGTLLETARQRNDAMPAFVVDHLEALVEESGRGTLADADVTVLGVTYRPGVDEIRASPAHEIVAACNRRGANVSVVDPVCSTLEAFDATSRTVEQFQQSSPDGVVLVTNQPAFDDIDWELLPPTAVIDGRQALALQETDHQVYTIGRGRIA